MSSKDEILECIKLKLIANASYNGNHVIIAPLVLGYKNKELKVFAILLDGYSKSNLQGTSNSSFRLYDLDKLTGVEATLVDFNLDVDKSYLTKSFDSIVIVLD